MQIPLIRERDFTEAENQKDAPCVRIVNEAMARRYWPGEDPVGKQLQGACPKDAPALVVGVVSKYPISLKTESVTGVAPR